MAKAQNTGFIIETSANGSWAQLNPSDRFMTKRKATAAAKARCSGAEWRISPALPFPRNPN